MSRVFKIEMQPDNVVECYGNSAKRLGYLLLKDRQNNLSIRLHTDLMLETYNSYTDLRKSNTSMLHPLEIPAIDKSVYMDSGDIILNNINGLRCFKVVDNKWIRLIK